MANAGAVVFPTMYNGGTKKSSLDYSRTKEPIYKELPPYACDVETGEVLNNSSEVKIVQVGEIDIDEKIQSYHDDVDIYRILEKFALTGDSSLVNRRIGTFGDIVDIPDNVNDFAKYVDAQIDKLKEMDPKIASAVVRENISASELESIIQESVKSALIKAQATEVKTSE